MLINSNKLGIDFRYKFSWLGVVMIRPLFCTLATSLLTQVRNSERFAKVFQFWVLWVGLFAVACADIQISTKLSRTFELLLEALYPGYVLGAVVAVVLFLRKDFSQSRKIFTCGVLGLYLAMFLKPILNMNSPY